MRNIFQQTGLIGRILTIRHFVRNYAGVGILCALFASVSFLSCSDSDYFGSTPEQFNSHGFRLTLGGDLSRSSSEDAILDGLRLYSFDRSLLGGDEPEVGSPSAPRPVGSGSLLTPFHHLVQGLARIPGQSTLSTDEMRVGKWDLAMVSAGGASLTPPTLGVVAGKSLMYTYAPSENGGNAYEFYTRYQRLPEITLDNHPYALTAVSRNVAKIQITIDRAVDVDAAASPDAHTVTLKNIPKYVSWAGTLLKSVSGGYETSTSDFATVDPVTGSVSFTAGAEPGTYTSNMLTYIIPAHRSSDFWSSDGVTPNPSPTDTITTPLTLELVFTKPGGRGTFTKTVDIPRVPRCNQLLDVHVKMKDVNVEIITSVEEWNDKEVSGDIDAPYLNVSSLSTAVYDGAVSRIYFWSNQPDDKVYVESLCLDKSGNTQTTDDIFGLLGGSGSVNRHYDPGTGMGWLDISQTQTDMAITDDAQKEYRIRLNSGGLTREITVSRNVSNYATRAISTPYVGTFHRWDQLGERIVTWAYTGEWNAVVEGASASEVLLDRFASPSLIDGSLFGDAPGVAEEYKVSEGAAVWGVNRIYFRVGWKSAGIADAVRYAKIVVRKGVVAGRGDLVGTLYLRQGEEADYLMRREDAVNSGGFNSNTRPMARQISPYNVATPNTFVDYPTKAGRYYQWNRTVGYTTDDQSSIPSTGETSWDIARDVCPTGYRVPADGVDGNPGTDISASEIRQSLFQLPQTGDNNSSPETVLGGYYADGYFDRRAVTNPPASLVGTANSMVGALDQAGFMGWLRFNPNNDASLFIPAAGYFYFASPGAISLSHLGSDYVFWNSTKSNNGRVWRSAKQNQHTDFSSASLSVRCVKLAPATLTFNSNGGSGTLPVPITRKELETVVLPDPSAISLGVSNPASFWTTSVDGSGTKYASGAVYRIPIGGATLYAQSNVKDFYVSTRWTVPAGVYTIDAFIVGGGGGGAGDGRSTSNPGSGGNGGQVVVAYSLSVSPGQVLSIVVGTGGTGGAPGVHQSYGAFNGGDSSVDAIRAVGGAGGRSSDMGGPSNQPNNTLGGLPGYMSNGGSGRVGQTSPFGGGEIYGSSGSGGSDAYRGYSLRAPAAWGGGVGGGGADSSFENRGGNATFYGGGGGGAAFSSRHDFCHGGDGRSGIVKIRMHR